MADRLNDKIKESNNLLKEKENLSRKNNTQELEV